MIKAATDDRYLDHLYDFDGDKEKGTV